MVALLWDAGRVNAAPFSFFNAVSSDPPVVVLGINGTGAEGGYKDTESNIRETGEFVVNLVDEALAERMNICAVDFPAEIGELGVLAGMPMPVSAASVADTANVSRASSRTSTTRLGIVAPCCRKRRQQADQRAADIADQVHHFTYVHVHAPLIDNCQWRIQLFREGPRALHASRVRRNHRQVRQIQLPEIFHQHRRGVQVIHGHVEIPLYLRRMQIQSQRSARSRRFQQIRHQFRGDRHPRLVLAVLPRIAVIRQHRGNSPGRGARQALSVPHCCVDCAVARRH